MTDTMSDMKYLHNHDNKLYMSINIHNVLAPYEAGQCNETIEYTIESVPI